MWLVSELQEGAKYKHETHGCEHNCLPYRGSSGCKQEIIIRSIGEGWRLGVGSCAKKGRKLKIGGAEIGSLHHQDLIWNGFDLLRTW